MSSTPGLGVILGAPRSGTTWLQRLLASSTRVATPQETHLFWVFAGGLQQSWDSQVARVQQRLRDSVSAPTMAGRITGLPTLLQDEDLLTVQRSLVERLMRRAAGADERIAWVLEKSPSNSLCVDLIDRVVPDVRYLHIVRDPRDVMRSMLDASRTWGERWAPVDPRHAARAWVRHVEGARHAACVAPDRYFELRYEDLRADPERALGDAVEFLGLADDPADLVATERSAAAAGSSVFEFRPDVVAQLAALPGIGHEPGGFHGIGTRPELGILGEQAARIVAGPLAAELGYDLRGSAPGAASSAAWSSLLGIQSGARRGRRALRIRTRRHEEART